MRCDHGCIASHISSRHKKDATYLRDQRNLEGDSGTPGGKAKTPASKHELGDLSANDMPPPRVFSHHLLPQISSLKRSGKKRKMDQSKNLDVTYQCFCGYSRRV
ncbi:hypothetical protein PG993_011749 [Apiospora rasikravindrae]|uniref:Uncharacterized protein n=1 Tax=Apiospora rasikravindrae TaxID=990691 RepID=A0ABR1S0N7_9PEZI